MCANASPVVRAVSAPDMLARCTKLQHVSFYGMELLWPPACGVQRIVADLGMWAPGNGLSAGGAAALAGPLGKLVHLTSLSLSGTWLGGVVCVSRACMQAVPCPSVRGRLRQCEAV